METHLQQPKTLNLSLETPYTFNADSDISLRLYPDNRPQNLEIATLQKGLVLLYKGEEAIEEGAGFGVPIVMYGDEAYFCRTAKTQLQHVSQDSVVLKKTFLLDAISRKAIYGMRVNNGLYMFFQRAFQKGYLNQQKARPLFDWMMHLRSVLGVETEFVEVPPKGEVAITYRCFGDRIDVHADFSKVDRAGCTDILVLNEQGAKHFPYYRDSEGTQLFGRQVGAWARVAAKKASFVDPAAGLSFSLENMEGAALIRGREQVKKRFSWAGLTYVLNPCAAEFSYTIRLNRTPDVSLF